MSRSSYALPVLAGLLTIAGACGSKQAPVTSVTPQPQATFPGAVSQPEAPARPPQPPEPPPVITPDTPVVSDPLANIDTDEINRRALLGPVLFSYDSETIDEAGQKVLAANADILKKYPTWAITIEGHSDERGTAEYNLALGERRALAAKSYLLSLGISADRLRTVSYGKEFPFDPGHDEAAYARNRRAHFVVTAK